MSIGTIAEVVYLFQNCLYLYICSIFDKYVCCFAVTLYYIVIACRPETPITNSRRMDVKFGKRDFSHVIRYARFVCPKSGVQIGLHPYLSLTVKQKFPTQTPC